MSAAHARDWRLGVTVLALAFAACGSCVGDLSGTLCNAGGQCGPKYLCATDGRCIAEKACTDTACNGRCVNPATDAMNCGACGVQCPPAVACSAGTCACPAGSLACGAACVDPSSDASHCDSCGSRCDAQVAQVCGRSRCLDAAWALWPMPRSPVYALSQGLVTEATTGLVWEGGPGAGPVPLDAARSRCDALTLGGFTDWRLPSRIELISLLELSHSPTLDVTAFPGAPAASFWTASPVASTSGRQWAVGFGDGAVSPLDVSSAAWARCVR